MCFVLIMIILVPLVILSGHVYVIYRMQQMRTYHTWLIFNEDNTSITCPVSGGELSITNGDDTVYDDSPAPLVA